MTEEISTVNSPHPPPTNSNLTQPPLRSQPVSWGVGGPAQQQRPRKPQQRSGPLPAGGSRATATGTRLLSQQATRVGHREGRAPGRPRFDDRSASRNASSAVRAAP
eukprot:CAMPEP_0194667918 /NCGR_PEP_ID=MMETSP0295-20121207/3611_1 /TAXON_ID=39354 /ORGANISM="Heterosigma akashiwo, Strain CCMP2393" /LENGTH=105 /DNA_ID=CAMNT_0039550479 /DNA_START=365 /DNA_END=679 /DNA_ORIENTATION=-